jgi:hypothetical protein
MKKIYTTISILFFAITLNAQNAYDALTFSYFTPNGTARYTAMGGAFGSLGANLYTMSTNPAGTGILRKSEVGVSTTWGDNNVTSVFNNQKNSVDQSSFQLSNMGFVIVMPLSSGSGWRSVNFGFAYNHLNNYNRTFSVTGENNESSFLDSQTDLINRYPETAADNPYYQADLIFYDSLAQKYTNDFRLGNHYGALQAHRMKTEGYAGEYDINVSGNYNDFFYFGATVGIQNINYHNYTYHAETALSDEIALKNFDSHDYLDADGTGVNFKMGLMFKITHMFRVGAAFQTPTLMNMHYSYWTDVYSTLDFVNGDEQKSGSSPLGNYDWELKTPSRYSLSGAIVLSRLAIISAEMEYVDYSKLNIQAADYFFDDENSEINKIYKGAFNIKTGAEVRLWMLSLRGGITFMESPFASTEPNIDNYKLLLSAGLGISAGPLYFDAAYRYSENNEYYYMYGYESSKVELQNKNNIFTVSAGYKF